MSSRTDPDNFVSATHLLLYKRRYGAENIVLVCRRCDHSIRLPEANLSHTTVTKDDRGTFRCCRCNVIVWMQIIFENEDSDSEPQESPLDE